MDSRLLYSAASHLDSIIKWDMDWIHFGTGETIQFDLIIKIINEFLKDEDINFVYKRENSGSYKRTEIIMQIKSLLGHDNFQLWNMSMDKVIKFNKIGVLQIGNK